MPTIKCPICEDKYKNIESVSAHLEEEHIDSIPKNFTPAQYLYFIKTGRDKGNCIICHSPTKWNEVTNKYHRFCEDPKCKKKYREEFKKRMIGKYGKIHLLNTPEQQKKMLANRSISGEYIWSDGAKIPYTGSYELDFLKLLDNFMNFESSDIMSPSPHTYYYEHDGQQRFYIPDVFIPSLGLEIEIKDGGDNPNKHHKIQDVDKVKERLKDEVLMSQKSFSYVKITNKNYEPFFEILMLMKDNYKNNKKDEPIFVVKEASFIDNLSDINLTIPDLPILKYVNPILANKIDYMNAVSSFKFIRKDLINMVDKATTDRDIMFLENDKKNTISYLENLKRAEPRMERGCDEHIRWLKGPYSNMLKQKLKYLKNRRNVTESLINAQLTPEFCDQVLKVREFMKHFKFMEPQEVHLKTPKDIMKTKLKSFTISMSHKCEPYQVNPRVKLVIDKIRRHTDYIPSNIKKEDDVPGMFERFYFVNKNHRNIHLYIEKHNLDFYVVIYMDEQITTESIGIIDRMLGRGAFEIDEKHGLKSYSEHGSNIISSLTKERAIDLRLTVWMRAIRLENGTYVLSKQYEKEFRTKKLSLYALDASEFDNHKYHASSKSKSVKVLGEEILTLEQMCNKYDIKVTIKDITSQKSDIRKEGLKIHGELIKLLNTPKYKPFKQKGSISAFTNEELEDRFQELESGEIEYFWIGNWDLWSETPYARSSPETDVYIKTIDPFYKAISELEKDLNERVSDKNKYVVSIHGDWDDGIIEVSLKNKTHKEFIHESYIISEDDISINFDNWKKEKGNNILYITGHSGSGKTTLAWDLADKHDAIMIQMDAFEFKDKLLNMDSKNMDVGTKICYSYFMGKGKHLKDIDMDSLSDKEFHDELVKFFKWIKEGATSDYKHLYIIEGLQLFTHMDGSFFKDEPVIIKGTSVIKSYYRARKRRLGDRFSIPNLISHEIKHRGKIFKFFHSNEKYLNEFKKEIVSESSFFRLEKSYPSIIPYATRDISKGENLGFALKFISEKGNFFENYELSKLAHCMRYLPNGNLGLVKKDGENEEYEYVSLKNIKAGTELTVSWGDYSKYFGDRYDWFAETDESDEPEIEDRPISEDGSIVQERFDNKIHPFKPMRYTTYPTIDKNNAINKLLDSKRRVWLATDYHLYKYKEGIVKSEYYDEILNNQKNVVGDNDVFIYLGDLVDGEIKDPNILKPIIQSLKGIKILVLGNNDTMPEYFYLDSGFDYVVEGFRWKNIVFSHQPIPHDKNTINIHGHFHGSRKYYEIEYNNHAGLYTGGIESRPILLTDVIKNFKSGNYKGVSESYELIEESVSVKPFYFYHLIDKNVKLTSKGLLSPQAMLDSGMEELAMKSLAKYRNRIVGDWGIYPKKKAEDLTTDEIVTALRTFREDENGAKDIYFFRYPPYFGMGKNMDNILKNKKMYRINLNNPELRKNIINYDWGHDKSFTGNKKLTSDYYEKVSSQEYFKDYDDSYEPIFATLNHISIVTKDGTIPMKFLEEIPIVHKSGIRESSDEILEEKSLELLIARPDVYKQDTIELFHGTSNQLTKLSPISRNLGTRLSLPTQSVFFTDEYHVAYMSAILSLVTKYAKENNWTRRMDYSYNMDKKQFIIRKAVATNDFMKFLQSSIVYVFHANLPTAELKVGHVPREFTINREVIPDSVDELSYTSFKKDIIFLDDDDMKTHIEWFAKKRPSPYDTVTKKLLYKSGIERDIWNWYYQNFVKESVETIEENINYFHGITYEVRNSKISGKGTFAIKSMNHGEGFGIAFEKIASTGKPDNDYKRSRLGKYTNHSNNPNMKILKSGNRYDFIAARNINKGEELTVDYNTFDWEGKRDFTKESIENILEGKTETGLQPVYILLTYTGTTMSKIIRFYTGDPYSHASISFDSSMKDLYSFGRKFKDSDMTFINEDINEGIFKDVSDDAEYSLYVLFFTKEQINSMKKKLEYFKKNKGKLKFSFMGLFNIALGKESHYTNEYFCSQFVAELLKAADPELLDKDSSLYTPYELKNVKKAYFVVRGKLKNYNKESVDIKVSNIEKNNT